MIPAATLYSPTRGLWLWLRGTWKRLHCPHLPIPLGDGYLRCSRCGTFLP